MAVVPRKRKRGMVYGVLTSWSGGEDWELIGPNKREAERIDAMRKREVKAGTFRPGAITDAASVRAFAERWLEKRTNRTAENDRSLIRRHVLTVTWFASARMADVRPKDILKLAEELKGGTLSPKSVSLVMGLVRVMFRDAVIDDVLQASPYVVPRGTLKRSGKKRTPYEAAEAWALMSGAVGERERVWNAIAFYTGARCGEVCGLRWGDWDEAPAPLGCLTIERQYDGQVLKTERPRVAPVHPELARVLTWWRDRWSFHFLRRPGTNDLICPRSVLGGELEPLTKNAAYKAWIRSCKAAKVTNRSVHSTRHTFITHAQRGGAEQKLVELITHNAKGTIIDRYTTRSWAELCQATLSVQYDGPLDAEPNDGGNDGSRAWTRTSESAKTTRETRVAGEAPCPEDRAKDADSAWVDAPLDARPTDDSGVYHGSAWTLALVAGPLLRGRPGGRHFEVVGGGAHG